MKTLHFKWLNRSGFNSRIKSEEVKNKEIWLGYFLGPALVATFNGTVGGSYLNSFYTDVLQMNAFLGGTFLALMPLVSKIIDAITNIFMGQIVENTSTRHGKARPWILISGPLMALAAISLFAVPASTNAVKAAWMVCSYNLYFSISYTMYNLSNVITVPVSTRDNKKRDSIAMAQSMGISVVPGIVLGVVFPSFILPYLGVDQSKWIRVMAITSLLAVAGTLIQYFFTRERITEEGKLETDNDEPSVSLKDQIKGCLSSRYWVTAIIAVMIQSICFLGVANNSLLYLANWVVGTYNDGKTLTLLNVIGNAMLGPGILFMWPLVKKFGKQKVFIVFGFIATAGGFIGQLFAKTLTMALISLTIRAIGLLPYTYVLLSVVADALDHVEWKCGYRCDGFSSSVYSIIGTVTLGIGLGIINLGLALTGYLPPAADGSWVPQPEAVQNFLVFATFGLGGIGLLINTILFFSMDLEKKLPQIHADLAARKNKFPETEQV